MRAWFLVADWLADLSGAAGSIGLHRITVWLLDIEEGAMARAGTAIAAYGAELDEHEGNNYTEREVDQ